MTSWEVIGALTFMVCFALLVLFLSWDSRNDGGFGSMWFSPDNSRDVDIDKKHWAILMTMLILVIIILLIILF